MTFKEYMKCVYANKFLFTAYLAGALGLGSFALFSSLNDKNTPDWKISLQVMTTLGLSSSSMLLLTGTRFGEDTYGAYKRTKKHIKANHDIEAIASHYVKFQGNGEFVFYCSYKGVELAAKEHGLEKKAEDFYRGIYTDCRIFRYENK